MAKKILVTFVILSILCLPNFALASDDSELILKILIKKGVITQEEVNQMRQEIAAEKPKIKEAAKEEKPVIAKIAEALQPGYGKEAQLKFKGYVQTRYEWYELDSTSDTLKIKSAYIIPYGTIIQGWDFEAEIDAADTAGKPLRSAFIEYTGFKPYAAVRIGQQKPSYSEEFWTSSSMIDTIERALVVSNLSAERDIGVNVLGKLFKDKVDYGIGVFNGSGLNASDNNDFKDIAGRLVISPFKGSKGPFDEFNAGGAFWIGRQPRTTFDGTAVESNRDRFAGLLSYKYKRLKLQGEYLFQEFDKAAGGNKESDGWYVLGVYDLLKDYPNLQLVGKYEQYDPDRDVSNNRLDIATVGLNYFFNKYVKIMVDYRFRDEETEVNNDEFLTQLQVKF